MRRACGAGSDRIGRLRASAAARTGLAAAIFAVIAVGFFNPVFRSDATFSSVAGHQAVQFPWATHPTGFTDSVQSDQANYVYPIEVDVGHSLLRGLLPSWSTSSFTGLPTAGSAYSVMPYPGHLLLLALISPALAHDIFLLLHVWLAGLTMFLLLRLLRVGWLASVIGGATWMLAPAWFGLILLEGNAVLAALLPLALATGLLAVRRRSLPYLAACAVVQALLILGASIQNGVFCMLIVGAAMTLDRAYVPQRTGWLRQIGRNLLYAVPANLLGVLLAGFVLLPSQAAIADSRRSEVPYDVSRTLGFSLHHLGNAISPDVPRPLDGNTIWTLIFIGSIGGVLALIGLFSRRPGGWLARAITLVFGAIVVGSPATYVAYHVIPGFGYLSPLGRLTPYVALGGVLLLALGADLVLDGARSLAARRGELVAVSLALLAVGFQVWQLGTFDRTINPPFQPRTSAYLFPQTPLLLALESQHRAAIAAGQDQRIMPLRRGSLTGPYFPPPLFGNTAEVFGLENVGGYFNVIPPRSIAATLMLSGSTPENAVTPLVGAYASSFYAAETRFDLAERFGVTTIVGVPRAFPDPDLARKLRSVGARVSYSGTDGAAYTLPHAQPRAFFVSGSETVKGELPALRRFIEPSFPFRTTVLLDAPEGGRRVGPSGKEVVATIAHTGDDELRVRVDAPTRGWLVVLDSYARGWSATVNGRATPISRADYAYRAVPVARGESTIEMHYDPPWLTAGLLVSLLGVLITIGLLALGVALPRRAAQRPAATAPSGGEHSQ